MRLLSLVLVGFLTLSATSADAAILGRGAKPAPVASDRVVTEIQRALDEQRLLDAARYLDETLVAGMKDPRLVLLNGDLNLARGRYNAALAAYKDAEATPALRAKAMQGQGLALSLLGRSPEALTALQRAVTEDPTAWRAWNALGSEYDTRGQWTEAEAAYQQAITASGAAAIVLNNRGYSRLLQHRRDEAIADLVAALQKKPDMAEARTNLRLALAMGGDYDRAIAGGDAADQAAMLNNAGFAAGMRGDYAQAESLLGRALTLKGEYYGRASENLKIIRALAAQNAKTPDAAP
ncbi:MAG TPA: tetratricopeptide repeat protein [Phenylobacterium sp.]|nr:tetratricopeptide repeat protein [Phenylobacterium sp.]